MRTINWDNFDSRTGKTKIKGAVKAKVGGKGETEDVERPATVLFRKSQASIDKYLDKLMPFPF